MSQRSIYLRHGFGLALAFAVGTVLALTSMDRPVIDTQTFGDHPILVEQGVGGPGEGIGPKSHITPTPTSRQRKSEVFRQAWKLLHDRKMLPAEKKVLQMRMLAEWAEVDLDGALAAAAVAHRPNVNLGDTASFFGAFRERMKEDPEAFWPAIREGRFGLATADLQTCWMAEVGRNDPMALAARLKDFGPLARARAVADCVVGLTMADTEKRGTFLERIASEADTPESRRIQETVGQSLTEWNTWNSTDLQKLANITTNDDVRRMLLDGVGRYISALSDDRKIDAQFDALNEDYKKNVALGAISHSESEQSLRKMTDYLISQGEWAEIAENVPARLSDLDLPSTLSKEFVEWADALPERSETEAVYRTAVAGIVANQSAEEAKEWLNSRPEGWKRDNALAQYAITANQADAEWALARISDEGVRAEAQQKRDGSGR